MCHWARDGQAYLKHAYACKDWQLHNNLSHLL